MINEPTSSSKTAMVLERLKEKGEITAREMEVSPFYVNCPYRIIKNLRDKYGINILDEPVSKTKKVMVGGKLRKVTENYKRYFINKVGV